MKRNSTPFAADMNALTVTAGDIVDNAIESRHVADDELGPEKLATVEGNVGSLVTIQKEVTTGAAAVSVFDANSPFKFIIVDVIVEPRGASTNGTMKITNGTNDITNAMTAAVDKTIARAGTIDNAYSTIEVGGSLEIACAGDAVASTIGLVTIVAVKID